MYCVNVVDYTQRVLRSINSGQTETSEIPVIVRVQLSTCLLRVHGGELEDAECCTGRQSLTSVGTLNGKGADRLAECQATLPWLNCYFNEGNVFIRRTYGWCFFSYTSLMLTATATIENVRVIQKDIYDSICIRTQIHTTVDGMDTSIGRGLGDAVIDDGLRSCVSGE